MRELLRSNYDKVGLVKQSEVMTYAYVLLIIDISLPIYKPKRQRKFKPDAYLFDLLQ